MHSRDLEFLVLWNSFVTQASLSNMTDSPPQPSTEDFERRSVPEKALKGHGKFWGIYSGEHAAGTEFVIGLLFLPGGVALSDIILDQLLGNDGGRNFHRQRQKRRAQLAPQFRPRKPAFLPRIRERSALGFAFYSWLECWK